MTERTDAFPEPFVPENEKDISFDVIPPGKYQAEVVDASITAMKNGKGTMLCLSWVVTSGDYDGRYIFQNITHTHTESPEAMAFGRARIKALCAACGVTGPVTNVDVFQYKPCLIQVGIEKDKTGEYPDKNKVTRIMPLVVNTPLPEHKAIPPNAAPQKGNGAKTDLNDRIPF
jgi:Protein of unknown function (DUF669)